MSEPAHRTAWTHAGFDPRPRPRCFQLHVDILFLREGEHLLEAFLAPEARLLEAAEWRAEEVFAHLVDPDIARLDSERGPCAVERSLVQIEAVRPYSTAFTVASILLSSSI